eukprot:2623415-Rhodomonas_salina.1
MALIPVRRGGGDWRDLRKRWSWQCSIAPQSSAKSKPKKTLSAQFVPEVWAIPSTSRGGMVASGRASAP